MEKVTTGSINQYNLGFSAKIPHYCLGFSAFVLVQPVLFINGLCLIVELLILP